MQRESFDSEFIPVHTGGPMCGERNTGVLIESGLRKALVFNKPG